MTWLRAAVRRWGWKTVGAVITAFGLYVVLPSVVTLFGAWPDLEGVRPWWFVVLAGLQLASFASLWVLVRIAIPHARWRDLATSQLVGNAISKVLPGGAATGGVVQGRMLVVAGRPAGEVTSALTATGLMTTGVLLTMPVLTVPTLIIGPPAGPPAPARPRGVGRRGVRGDGARHDDAEVGPVRDLDRSRAGHLVHVVRRRGVRRCRRHGTFTRSATRSPPRSPAGGRPVARRRRGEPDVRLRRPGRGAATPSGAEIRPAMVLLAYVVAMALAMVPITPGGLGVVEAGLTTLLVLAGVERRRGRGGTLLYRLASYWLPIPLGALAWAAWQFRHRLPDEVHRVPDPDGG